MTILLLAPVLSCDDNQIVVPTDPGAVIWTRVTDPAQVKDPTYTDWRGDSVIFHYVAANGRTWLSLMNADGSNVTPFPQVGLMDEAYPRWITNDVVLYSSNDPGSFFGYDLRYKVLSTGEERRLTSFVGNEFGPAPRPGRPSIAYVEGTSIFQGRIVLLPDTAAVPLQRYYLTPDTLTAGEPEWSPDGNRLCFTVEKDGIRNLWIADVADTGATSLRQITTGPFFEFFPRFSPDGTKIAFSTNRTGRPGLWWVSPEGEASGLELISFEDSSDPAGPPNERIILVAPSWSPDGTKILVSSNARGDRAIWQLSNLPF